MSKKTTAKADIIRKEENYSISVELNEKEKKEMQNQIDALLRERWQAEEQISKGKLSLSRIGKELQKVAADINEGTKETEVIVEHHLFVKAKRKETYHEGKLVDKDNDLASYEMQTEIGDKVLNKAGDYEEFIEEEEA